MWLKTCYFCIYPLSNLHDRHYGISTRKTPAYVCYHVAYSEIPKYRVRLSLYRPASFCMCRQCHYAQCTAALRCQWWQNLPAQIITHTVAAMQCRAMPEGP